MKGCRFALWALVAFGAVLAYGDAAPGFTVDTAIPAGNAIVNAIDGDTVSIRQDLRDTKGEWFYWAFRVKGAAGRTVRFDFRKPDGTALDIVGVRGPVVSKDGGKTFSYPLDGKATTRGFTYTFAPDENETLFYECHSYVRADWDAFVAGEPVIPDGPGGSFEERLMLALRLTEGYRGEIPPELREKASQPMLRPFLEVGDDCIRLTKEGFLVSNTVIAELL